MSAASLESNLDSLQGFFHPDAESHWWASLIDDADALLRLLLYKGSAAEIYRTAALSV